MKKLSLKYYAVLCSLLFLSIPLSLRADLLDGWDFNTLAGLDPATLSATVGSGSLDLSAYTQSERTNFAGSTLNTFPGGAATAGGALAIIGGTGGSANGKSMIFSISTLGYEDIMLEFATRGTATGFDNGTWSWSTDNLTYTALVGVNTATHSTTFALAPVVDFSAISAIDNQSTVYLEYTLSGATSTSGNNRIDNLTVSATAVPEPTSIALAALGGFSILGISIFRKQK